MDYKLEICVILINHGIQPFVIKNGDRIAQMVLNKVENINWVNRQSLSDTSRDGGFGSTGIK